MATVNTVYETIRTLNNPCVSTENKVVATGVGLASVALPGVAGRIVGKVIAKAGTRGAVSSGGAGPVRKGQAGENAVRAQYDIGTKKGIEINGRKRVPDGITKDAVHEVKNKSYVSNSQQIRDYIDIAKQTGRDFNL